MCRSGLYFLQVVYYGKNISGQLSYGKIESLSGIQTQQLFVWLPVTGFYVDDPPTPYIYFQVGVLTKRLAKATFESEPKCRSHAFKEQLHGFHVPAWVQSLQLFLTLVISSVIQQSEY